MYRNGNKGPEKKGFKIILKLLNFGYKRFQTFLTSDKTTFEI